MFKISDKTRNEFASLFENHRVHIAACNIFFQNIRMLNGRHKLLDRETFVEYFKNIVNDIDLESSPIDSFIPADDTVDDLFLVNQLVPEYKRISGRMTLSFICDILPPTNEISMKLKADPNLLETVVDDIFVYYSLFKYLDQIDMIRLKMLSNITPIIEYTVQNISERDIKDFIISRKINEEKYNEKCVDILFNPDVAVTQKFYALEHAEQGIPSINVINLMMRLVTNTVLKSDIYIILSMYTILSFAMSDIRTNNMESQCAKYVRDVLSKI